MRNMGSPACQELLFFGKFDHLPDLGSTNLWLILSLSLSRWFLCLANNCVESQAKDASCCRRDCKVFILPAAISEFHRISLIVFATTNHGPAPLVVCSGWWWAQRPSRRKDWLTSHLKRIVLVWPLFISKTNLTDRNIRKNMHKSSSNMHLSHIIRKMKHQLMPG